MIILPEVATKLERILNSLDGYTNPLPYYFQVETEGFHIDHIKRPDQEGNFIPVFISSLGGQFNPVKGLKQATYSIPVVFYYPVRFKDDFFALGEFLEDTFVGSKINYGAVSGSAISNISVPQYGEIQNLDFQEFKKWVNAKYTRAVDVMEPYMSMQFTLYLSSAALGLLFGNDITTSLSFTIDGETFILNDVDIDGASIQSNTQAQSEQEEGTSESFSVPFSTAYGSSFKVYPNLEKIAVGKYKYIESESYDSTLEYYYKVQSTPGTRAVALYISLGYLTQEEYNEALTTYTTLYNKIHLYFYRELLKAWVNGRTQEMECHVSFKIGDYDDLIYTRKCFLQSVVVPIEKGQLLGFTFTFANMEDNN